jgi:hypothetical protein
VGERGVAPGGVCTEASCAVTVSRKLGAGSVVFGSVSQFGKLIAISVTILDLYSESVVEELRVESLDAEAGIPDALDRLAGLFEERK